MYEGEVFAKIIIMNCFQEQLFQGSAGEGRFQMTPDVGQNILQVDSRPS